MACKLAANPDRPRARPTRKRHQAAPPGSYRPPCGILAPANPSAGTASRHCRQSEPLPWRSARPVEYLHHTCTCKSHRARSCGSERAQPRFN